MEPALLTLGHYYGTLAAARCLGEAGVRVVLAESKLTSMARWSRHIGRRVDSPPVGDPEAMLAFLERFGREHGPHVLYPTSDDLAWLFSQFRDRLSQHFRMYVPPVAAVMALLDKRKLHENAAAVGLLTPRAWYVEHEDDVQALADQVTYPLLIKPRTQAYLTTLLKGTPIHDAGALVAGFRQFVQGNRYHPLLLQHAPEVRLPMLQAFHPEAADSIYSVAGFVDEAGRVVARASKKLLQRPRKIGIGLCFRGEEVRPHVVEKISALARRVGYHGVFEAELIQAGGQELLIDFNPRYYSQMAFEQARGLPQALLVHYASTGRKAEFEAAFAAAQDVAWDRDRVYVNRLGLELVLNSQRVSGKLSADEAKTWRRWLRDHQGRLTDASYDRGDPIPALADATNQLIHALRHPRSFLRMIVLDK